MVDGVVNTDMNSNTYSVLIGVDPIQDFNV